MKVQVITDPEFIAAIKARSVRAPHRDVPDSGIECWREGSTEHFFLHGAYWDSISWIPVQNDPPVNGESGT